MAFTRPYMIIDNIFIKPISPSEKDSKSWPSCTRGTMVNLSRCHLNFSSADLLMPVLLNSLKQNTNDSVNNEVNHILTAKNQNARKKPMIMLKKAANIVSYSPSV